MSVLDVYSDGACSGNPGEASIGVVFKKDGHIIKEISQTIGVATNNIAEYSALIAGLKEALMLNASEIRIHTDSEWMFSQIQGTYKVKSQQIRPLYEQAMALAKNFKRVELKRIPREENQDADRLAKNALKFKTSQGGRPDVFVIGEESPSSRG